MHERTVHTTVDGAVAAGLTVADVMFIRRDHRVVRAVGDGDPRGGAAVNAENLVGLVLAVALTVFLVVALLFPERF